MITADIRNPLRCLLLFIIEAGDLPDSVKFAINSHIPDMRA